MSPAAPEFAVREARVELAALAAAVRPDWDPDVVAGTIQRAIDDEGMTWRQVLATLPRLMADELAGPRSLIADTRSPLRREPGTEATQDFRDELTRLQARTAPDTAPDGAPQHPASPERTT